MSFEILRLPPSHCQLSAIELFWGWLKQEVAKEAYPNIKVQELRDLTLRVVYSTYHMFLSNLQKKKARHYSWEQSLPN
ncbi:unnamed protein product [Enterobius vermicularis]|uniref:DDE_3 domain-containing protein n=1 Tax=Enterobius vermicularis TaxID=51028 RepID=A0A0N4VC43_ENTVE|nr:unnamed protein product [Enterobius vermicularis]